ncbi:MAG: hypothetical protein QXS15_00070 [Candidatus Jordarchaeales archaeon]
MTRTPSASLEHQKQGNLETIKKGAGFRDVRVVVETSFPVENAVGDLI